MRKLALALVLILLVSSICYAEAPYEKSFNELFTRCMLIVTELKKNPTDSGFSDAFACADMCKKVADEGRDNYVAYGTGSISGRLGLWEMSKYEPLRATILLGVADAYLKKGDKANAKKTYRQLVMDFDPQRHRAAVKKAEFALEDLK